MVVVGQQTKRKPLSFRWLFFVPFIAIAAVYPIVLLNYATNYARESNIINHHPPNSATPSIRNNGDKEMANKRNSSSVPIKSSSDVIVYLAQFGNHSSYGVQYDAQGRPITGLSKLNKSLELLYNNYVNQFPTAVIIFYEQLNAPDANTMEILLQSNRRPNLQFRSLDTKKWWSLPYGLQSWQHVTWNRPAFSIGYRLMMRWYAILIWYYLDAEGYTHCMRLDDDSYILSRIGYNLFDHMRNNNKRFGFSQPVWESGGPEFDALIDGYLMANHPNNDTVAYSQELIDLYKQDRGVGFYNNFFMADVSFFMKPPAATLLRIIDESKLIFTQRTGDLVIQSAVVRLFLPPDQIHWFRDFVYEHMTLCRKEKCGPLVHQGCPQNGGVSRGIGIFNDTEWRTFAQKEVQDRFKNNPNKCHVPINSHFVGADDVRICSRTHSRCGFYLKLLSGVDGTVLKETN